jgi:hypothetical protein
MRRPSILNLFTTPFFSRSMKILGSGRAPIAPVYTHLTCTEGPPNSGDIRTRITLLRSKIPMLITMYVAMLSWRSWVRERVVKAREPDRAKPPL